MSANSIAVIIVNPAEPRAVVEFALERKALLSAIQNGDPLLDDPFDAHEYLFKAAQFHGELTTRDCPVCQSQKLVELRYVYSKELGPYSGRIKSQNEINEMAYRFGNLKVFTVEVCSACNWNYLIRSYQVGDGVPRRPLRRSKDWLD
jgi:hypothetical protein